MTYHPSTVATEIFGPGGSYCSSGFTVTNFYGTHYAIAAAHCWQNGTAVTTSGINVTDPHIPFGTVEFNGFQDGGNIDAELIGGVNYAGRLWTGDVFSTVSQPATSVRNSCTGCVVYFDGSLTGQTVLATLIGSPYAAYFCDVNGNNCHDGVATQEVHASSRICRGGDSGGPVEVQDGFGGIIAVGVIRACSADGLYGWYTQLPPVLSHWVSTLTLG